MAHPSLDDITTGRAGWSRAADWFASADAEARAPFLNDLLSRASESREALELLLQLVRQHRLVLPPIRRYLIAEDDVDAAEQQTLVAIAFRSDSYSGTGSARSWMNQVAANEAKMLIRSRERHQSRAEGTVDDHQADFVQRLSTQIADAATIQACLAQLRDDWRRALELRESGLGYADVAARMEIAEGTAKTWVARGRRALADLLMAQHDLIKQGGGHIDTPTS